ncbi:hypothetical protein ACT4X5_00425 [Acinetobacter baumannii]
MRGHYTQEYYKLWGTDLGSVTIRFPIIDDPNNVGYWERCLDDKVNRTGFVGDFFI